jgi:hypothetical protein
LSRIWNDPDDLWRVRITIRIEEELASAERKAIAKALRNSHIGRVRIDEKIFSCFDPAGESDGLRLELDVRMWIWEAQAATMLAAAVAEGVAPIVKVLRKRMASLVARVYREDQEPVAYMVNSPEELKALDAMSADYELTMRTKARTVVWRDGGWERHEPIADITSGEVDLSNPHVPVVKLSHGPTRHWAGVFDEYIRWAKGGPIPRSIPGGEFHFGDVVIQSDLDVRDERIVITLRPTHATYEDIRAFVDEAIGYANREVRFETTMFGGEVKQDSTRGVLSDSPQPISRRHHVSGPWG